MNSKIIDSHFHIFDLDVRKTFPNQNVSHGFPEPHQKEICRFAPFFPPTLLLYLSPTRTHTVSEAMSEMKQANVVGAVFVQCYSDCPEETDWVYSQVAAQPGVLGVVAGLDLLKHQKVNFPFWNYNRSSPSYRTNR